MSTTVINNEATMPGDLLAAGWTMVCERELFYAKHEGRDRRTLPFRKPEEVFYAARQLQELHEETDGAGATAIEEQIVGDKTSLVHYAYIRTDGGTQPRATLDEAVVAEYAEAMNAGAEFPPLIVFYDGQNRWLADGFHRLAAYRQIDRHEISCTVRQGTRRDAVLYSVAANATHGLQRTNADKRRAVETLLSDDEWRKWSDAEIARRSAVSDRFVSKMRKELSPNGSEIGTERKVTRGDTTYTINTERIGATQKEVTEVREDESPSLPFETEREITTPAEMISDAVALPATVVSSQSAQPVRAHDEARKEPQHQSRRDEPLSVDTLLKGRTLVVTYTYIPYLPGKVSVGVRVGEDATTAAYDTLDSSRVRHSPERVLAMIAEQLETSEKKSSEKRAASKKQSTVKNRATAAALKSAKAAVNKGSSSQTKKSLNKSATAAVTKNPAKSVKSARKSTVRPRGKV